MNQLENEIRTWDMVELTFKDEEELSKTLNKITVEHGASLDDMAIHIKNNLKPMFDKLFIICPKDL